MKYPLILLIGIFVIVLGISDAYPMEKGNFQPPNLEGYTIDRVGYLDKDEMKDGVKETRLDVFKNSSGQLILKYTTNGKIWAWGVVNKPNDIKDLVNNYVLRDSKGNGDFDERYASNEHFYLPEWVKGNGQK